VPELLAENEKLWLLVQRMLRHRYAELPAALYSEGLEKIRDWCRKRADT